jgi:hypothetical protein
MIMKKSTLLATTLLALATSVAPVDAGATKYWDPSGNGTGGGTGLWANGTTGSNFWAASASGGTLTGWANANNDDADFRGAAGTVSLATSSSGNAPLANSVIVEADGYTFTGATGWGLTLSSGTVNVTN